MNTPESELEHQERIISYTPKYHKLYLTPDDAIVTYEWALRKSPVATTLWQECKQVLFKVGITLSVGSYDDAITTLHDDIDDNDEVNKLRVIIKQNLITYYGHIIWIT